MILSSVTGDSGKPGFEVDVFMKKIAFLSVAFK